MFLDYSFYCKSFQANKSSPEFTTKYKSIEQLVEINFTILLLRLHQEGLSELLQIANKFQTKLEKATKSYTANRDRVGNAGEPLSIGGALATITEEPSDGGVTSSKPLKSVASIVDSIKMKVIAKMEEVGIKLECERREIADLKVSSV